MATTAVILDHQHFQIAQAKARELGTTTDEFVSKLIDTEQALTELSFDQLLTPIREGFAHLSDDELDAVFAGAKNRSKESQGQ